MKFVIIGIISSFVAELILLYFIKLYMISKKFDKVTQFSLFVITVLKYGKQLIR